ncbi:hypothetical protein [Paenibacillus sp. 1-18]|uniref:hypothetical protein n=1 Tax=Paenibacillus sp. 1-18 TaxID=1333846 RepID=UPI0004719EF5|nr:hypothetical protein [Paenibacillus sp. 1-18]
MKLMDRDAALQDFLGKYVLEAWTGDIPLIEDYYQKHGEEIQEELLRAVETVCLKAASQQQEGNKGDIRYMYISLMRTSIMAGKVQYRIDAYDQNWFLDSVECSAMWSADFVFQPLLNRMTEWETVKGAYARKITTMDLEQIQQIEAVKYHVLTIAFLKSMVSTLIDSKVMHAMKKAAGFTLYAGEYRDESDPLCQLEHQGDPNSAEGAEERWIIFS